MLTRMLSRTPLLVLLGLLALVQSLPIDDDRSVQRDGEGLGAARVVAAALYFYSRLISFLMLFAFGARAPATERTTLCAPSLHRRQTLSLWQANNELSRHAACVPMRPHHYFVAGPCTHAWKWPCISRQPRQRRCVVFRRTFFSRS
jgi:hypothetical protein